MPSARLTLTNGLQVTLRHAPHLKRCAAAIRVRAGSHDAPQAWPGLAHFLEHLFFLGNARFPVDDALMRYVQRQGGQVNASTRERTTDFFFEVPVAAFEGGLTRLCEMLARPQAGLAQQQREREVIHAEFIAWARNPEAQRQFALLQCVSAQHPLAAFHAGNRYSLPLYAGRFQQALKDFHQRFYHAGQMTLSLVGPQSLSVLQGLAEHAGALFAPGLARAQRAGLARRHRKSWRNGPPNWICCTATNSYP
ncbi:pyrroloquinoline quinone biosynthesis protein PqqF, partial [Pseudomonas sp. MAFF212428]|nr:pyrroloquinoline quinone biosynthesis protein PqqF [Pseudomonas brassicae]